MVRSEVVHIGWLQVDASSYRFAAVLGGSPSEGHCMVHRPCATVECSCIALSLADSRRSRSEPVHVDGTRVDASKDVPTAGVRGSPVTASVLAICAGTCPKSCANLRLNWGNPGSLQIPDGAMRGLSRWNNFFLSAFVASLQHTVHTC